MTRSDRWKTQFAILIALLAVAVVVVAACGDGDENGYGASEPVAAEPAAAEPVAVTGGRLVGGRAPRRAAVSSPTVRCVMAQTHRGRVWDRPLLDRIYEPGHHPDASFIIAVLARSATTPLAVRQYASRARPVNRPDFSRSSVSCEISKWPMA